jgi:hypothetical protein
MQEGRPWVHPQDLQIRNRHMMLIASLISLPLLLISILLSIQRNPETGALSINPVIIFIGLSGTALVFLAIMPKRQGTIPTRPCNKCRMPIPVNGIFCPYCGYEDQRKV